MARPKKMQLLMLYDKVLVRRIEKETTTESGLVIPDIGQEEEHIGIVEAAGNGAPLTSGELRPLSVKAGDKIMWEKYAGIPVKLNGEDRVILSEEEIYGIVKEWE
jgi:chaperonin GroES